MDQWQGFLTRAQGQQPHIFGYFEQQQPPPARLHVKKRVSADALPRNRRHTGRAARLVRVTLAFLNAHNQALSIYALRYLSPMHGRAAMPTMQIALAPNVR